MNRDTSIEEAILHPELRHINFFNGRLLTGGDLEAEQRVQHAHARHLGSAIGVGVAFGLEVSRGDDSPPGGPVLVISAGLALNRAGQTLRLECDQRIGLIVTPDGAAADACVFDDCDPKAAGDTFASGTGYYVLTIAPASRPEGKAAVSGLGNGAALCNSRYFAEGVKFRLFRMNLAVNNTERARNLLAKACLGLNSEISGEPWPDTLPASHGWETLMPTGFPAGSDVPLAAFEWGNSGLGLLKLWPVRRRIAEPNAAQAATGNGWGYFVSDQRASEGEALFLDFQDDLRAVLAAGGNAQTSGADRWFAQLPPAGVLPAALDWKQFLGALGPAKLTPMDVSLWPARLRESFTLEPINVPNLEDATKPRSGVMLPALRAYRVPGRGEVLFARSPLGRLRLFEGAGGSDLLGVIICPADGSLRGFPLVGAKDWPLIVDDIPAGDADIWLVRAEAGRLLLRQMPDVQKAEAVLQEAQADAKIADTKAGEALAKADSVMKLHADELTIEKTFAAVQAVNAAMSAAEEARQASLKTAEARAQVEQVRAAAQAKPAQQGMEVAAASFDKMVGTITPEIVEALLRVTRFVRQNSVRIVNGRTADESIAGEQ